MSLSSGTKVGPYEILAPIGAGGMGEVYLAQDSRLGRKVALKILAESVSSDERAKSRFLKEAKAASSLNNPHIVTVYDVITQDHSDVIVMEFMEGESLRKILSRGSVQIKRALEIAADVASALAAAHNAGIIHRDIKPENILITKTNVTKVLDFGLAKLVTKEHAPEESQVETASAMLTHSGSILGTVAYMSPEQAQGQQLDNRTDIFSLGIVLFEMLSGKRPFQGNSTVDTLHAILHQDPLKSTQVDVTWADEVSDVLNRALAKNPEERYQHAGDFALDLRKLKREVETNSLPSLRSNITRQSNIWKYLLLIVVAIAAAMTLALWKSKSTQPRVTDESLYAKSTLTPLTVDPGYEWGPTFSPDGETIAYVSDHTGNFEIFLKQISGGRDINLTNNAADDVQPAFSPDGKQIAFVSTRSSQSDLHYPGGDSPLVGGDIWMMPALGGSARRIVENANFPSWSPDGSHILYSSGTWFRQRIYTVSASGGTASEIPIHFSQAPPARLYYPVYSPSGSWILFTDGQSIFLVNAKGGEPKIILAGTCPAWLSTNKIVYSNGEPGKNFSLWEVPFSDKDGKILTPSRPLTIGHGRDLFASPSRDGSRIAFASVDLSSNLEVMPFDADGRGVAGAAHAITQGNDTAYFSNFSPDGRTVVFQSTRGASAHIWRTDSESGEVQLTSDPNYIDGYPRYSPDGIQIAFTRNNELWLMAADGANPRSLEQRVAGSNGFFVWRPDGRAIIYQSRTDKKFYSLDLASRKAHVIFAEPSTMPVVALSPDGRWLVYQTTMRGNVDIRAVLIDGGAPRFVVATPHQDYHPFVSPSGKWLYFQYDHKNIYRVPGPAQNWQAKEPEKVTNFPESGLTIEDPQISRDGKQLLYSRAKITGDIWILNLPR